MERYGRNCSLAGSACGHHCDNQSLRMADLFDRTGSSKLEDPSCLRANHDYGLRYGTALRTKRSRTRLLGGTDVVGHSVYFMVCTRYGSVFPGHRYDGELALCLSGPCRRRRLWSAVNLRRIRFSFAPTCSRM